MTIDDVNAAWAAAINDPSFAAMRRLALVRGAYLEALALSAEGKQAVDLHNAASRSLAEAVKAGRHSAKDAYVKMAEQLDEHRKARSRFEAARASTASRH